MKKFIYAFVFYIGCALLFFKAVPCVASERLWTDDAYYNQLIHEASIKAQAEEKKLGQETKLDIIKRVENEIFKFFLMPFIIDKVYPDKELNQDVTPLLKLAWPTASSQSLEALAPFFKTFVAAKRRYTYAVNRLKQTLKAANWLPTDAPIVAKDGEFAPKYTDKVKETGANEYKVSYTPYQYLEYDKGELGEPVRRRDKNYQEIADTTYGELVLSLLEFDLAGFFNALKKMPLSNDGTREKPNDLGDGVQSRILLATKLPGDMEKIEGVIEIHVPQGFYINGDYLNLEAKPKFFLSEDKDTDLNIKGYQLYYPMADGVISHGRTQRILTGDVKFPIEISRKDVDKPLYIRGTFRFELCRQNSFDCHYVDSHHALSLEPSNKEMPSVHENFVRMSFLDLPQEEAHHARLTHAFYTPKTKQLTLKFETSKTFSNAAAMAENAVGTDFINPRYQIDKNEITVTFDRKDYARVAGAGTMPSAGEGKGNGGSENANQGLSDGGAYAGANGVAGEEIAVSATFDDRESLRTVVVPQVFEPIDFEKPSEPDYWLAFWFGVLMSVMPMGLCLLQRLLILFREKEKRWLIFVRYTIGAAVGLAVLSAYIISDAWYLMYGAIWLNTAAVFLSVSYLSILLGYMNFDLYRPFKRILRRGFLMGVSAILFMAAFPYYLKTEVLGSAPVAHPLEMLGYMALIWLGLLVLPFIGLLAYRHIVELPLKLRYLNVPYTVFYILGLFGIAGANRGLTAFLILLVAAVLVFVIWYIYPLLAFETMKHRRAKNAQIALFERVQRYCTFILAGVFGLTLLTSYMVPLKVEVLPEPTEVLPEVEQKAKSGQAILVSFNADWQQPLAISNRIKAKTLGAYGIEVLSYRVPTYFSQAQVWFEIYGKTVPPLNILFTKRHPQGLLLPDSLDIVDWDKAIQNLSEMK